MGLTQVCNNFWTLFLKQMSCNLLKVEEEYNNLCIINKVVFVFRVLLVYGLCCWLCDVRAEQPAADVGWWRRSTSGPRRSGSTRRCHRYCINNCATVEKIKQLCRAVSSACRQVRRGHVCSGWLVDWFACRNSSCHTHYDLVDIVRHKSGLVSRSVGQCTAQCHWWYHHWANPICSLIPPVLSVRLIRLVRNLTRIKSKITYLLLIIIIN